VLRHHTNDITPGFPAHLPINLMSDVVGINQSTAVRTLGAALEG
jgi:hypothetical protein